MNEQTILKSLRHENIVLVHGCYEDPIFYYTVMDMYWKPLMSGLNHFVASGQTVTEGLIMSVMSDVFAGLTYLHSPHNRIIHRDIKVDNIMFKTDSVDSACVLIDFGFAKEIQPGTSLRHPCGTIRYTAPEVLQAGYGFLADLWSAGVVMYLILFGRFPFDGGSTQEVLKSIIQSGAVPPDYSPPAKPFTPPSPTSVDLLKSLLCPATHRISAEQALRHNWLMDISDDSSSPSRSATISLPRTPAMQNEESEVFRAFQMQTTNLMSQMDKDWHVKQRRNNRSVSNIIRQTGDRVASILPGERRRERKRTRNYTEPFQYIDAYIHFMILSF